MFGDGSDQVVIKALICPAAHKLKSMDMAADEGLKTLAVGKLDIEPAAMAFNTAKGIELALVSLVIDGIEMPPVDLKTISRAGFDTYIGARRSLRLAQCGQVFLENRPAAGIAERSDALP